MVSEQLWHSVRDVSDILGLNERTVRKLIREGELVGAFMGGRAGYRVSDLELKNFLDRRTGKSPARVEKTGQGEE